jgi:hypothetical protein
LAFLVAFAIGFAVQGGMAANQGASLDGVIAAVMGSLMAGAEIGISGALGYGFMANTAIGFYNSACDSTSGSFAHSGMCGLSH